MSKCTSSSQRWVDEVFFSLSVLKLHQLEMKDKKKKINKHKAKHTKLTFSTSKDYATCEATSLLSIGSELTL